MEGAFVFKRTRSAHDRFWEKVTKADACWIWLGARGHRLGYGRFRPATGQQIWAHRWAYEESFGPIPAGLTLDHLCRTPACIRPDHLEAVTQKVNVLRGESFAAANAAKTHCPWSHLLAGDNLYVNPRGARECRACRTYYQRRRRQRLRES